MIIFKKILLTNKNKSIENMVEQNNDAAGAVAGGETETFNWPPLESNPDIFASYMG